MTLRAWFGARLARLEARQTATTAAALVERAQSLQARGDMDDDAGAEALAPRGDVHDAWAEVLAVRWEANTACQQALLAWWDAHDALGEMHRNRNSAAYREEGEALEEEVAALARAEEAR